MWPEAKSYETSWMRLPLLVSCMYRPAWLPLSGKPYSSSNAFAGAHASHIPRLCGDCAPHGAGAY